MSPEQAFKNLAEAALENRTVFEDRDVLLESLAVLAAKAGLPSCLDQTTTVLTATRAAEEAQLQFREFLSSSITASGQDGTRP